MSGMTKSEQIQFFERLDTLRKMVFDKNLLEKNARLVQDEEWGGANLIITADPNRTHWDNDTFVVVENIKSVLWLMDELRELYNGLGSNNSKYTYYPFIGESINEAIANGCKDTVCILTAMIDAAKEWASGGIHSK